jgi:predicted GIY-YIG superfamily endonuclease
MRDSINSPVFIYELRDPRDGRTYYVGASANPVQRYKQHLQESNHEQASAKNRWLLSLLKHDLKPQLAVARLADESNWLRVEAEAIRQHVKAGSPLTNIVATGRPRPDMRAQDFWDDLTPQFEELKRRVWIVKTPEGLVPYFLWNWKGRGWRVQYFVYTPGCDRRQGPDAAEGFRTHGELARAFRWWREAEFAWAFRKEYEGSLPVEHALSDAELGQTDDWKLSPKRKRVQMFG